MKKIVICIVLALLMCMVVTVPSLADTELATQSNRADISATFGLKHISGSTYKMYAIIKNPEQVSVGATLALYDASYNYITSIGTTSTNSTITLNKYVSLSSGTYHVRLNYTADGANHSFERTYVI